MKHKFTIKLKVELSIQPLYCSICGQPILGNQQMSLDHYILRCRGGLDEASNLFPAHKICNSIKSNLMPDEFERQKQKLYQTALDNWHLKHKEKQIVEKALQKMKQYD